MATAQADDPKSPQPGLVSGTEMGTACWYMVSDKFKYIPALDGLRAVAIAHVVISHYDLTAGTLGGTTPMLST
jgi:hypothetical protein